MELESLMANRSDMALAMRAVRENWVAPDEARILLESALRQLAGQDLSNRQVRRVVATLAIFYRRSLYIAEKSLRKELPEAAAIRSTLIRYLDSSSNADLQ